MPLLPKIKVDLTPLVESIPNGVGKIFELFFGKRIAKQKAANLLIEAKAKREAKLIEEGQLDIDSDGNITNFEQKQADNVQQCIEFAVQSVMAQFSQEEYTDENASQSFFNQWREYAKNIDEVEMKQLWGKLLAEEVSKPNTVSLRLLNLLSMVSKHEIEIFLKTLPYIIGEGFIIADFMPNNEKHKIFNILYDIGLISKIPGSIKEVGNVPRYTQNNFNYFHIYQRSNLIAFHDSSNRENLKLEFIELTNLGKSLYRITDGTNDEYETLFNSIIASTLKISYPTIHKISVYKVENNTVTVTLLEKDL